MIGQLETKMTLGYQDATKEVPAFVDFEYTPGTEDRFDQRFGNWLPGDEPEIKIIRVCVVKNSNALDLKRYLPMSVLDKIEKECWAKVDEERSVDCGF